MCVGGGGGGGVGGGDGGYRKFAFNVVNNNDYTRAREGGKKGRRGVGER